jgi:hypothetical protein
MQEGGLQHPEGTGEAIMLEVAELRAWWAFGHEVFEVFAIIWFAWRAQRMFAMHANSQRQITRAINALRPSPGGDE